VRRWGGKDAEEHKGGTVGSENKRGESISAIERGRGEEKGIGRKRRDIKKD